MGWGDYRWKHEPILYAVQKGQSTQFFGDRSQYTEWNEEPSDEELLKWAKKQIEKEEAGASTVWRLHRENNYDHPTQKPIKLINIAIKNSSRRTNIVVDFFGGSGSTLLAAERLGRKAKIMEMDPRWCDVIVERYKEFVGGRIEYI